MNFVVAIRTRSEGDWYKGGHFARLEIHDFGMKTALTYQRSEEGKRIRRELGDNGGVKFSGSKEPCIRAGQICGSLTSVQKDNYLLEIYEDNP